MKKYWKIFHNDEIKTDLRKQEREREREKKKKKVKSV